MNAELNDLLSHFSPAVQEVALKVRAVILESMPGAIEMVDLPSRLVAYGYRRKYADLICAIAPFNSHVNLMFGRGKELADPAGLLVGTGKRARHVKLKTLEEVDQPALRELLTAAIQLMES